MNMQGNPKIVEIVFLTPYVQTAAYGGTHRAIDRIVFRQRKTEDGRPTDEWTSHPEYEGWSARIEGPSLFVRPAFRNGPPLDEEWEIPRSQCSIKWDRSEEGKAERAKQKAEAPKADTDKKQTSA